MIYRVVILSNENESDHYLWIKSCEKFRERISYRTVQLTADNWLEEISKEDFDIMLAKPGGFTNKFKQIYDERLFLLVNFSGFRVFPSLDEVLIYENKRLLSYWLQVNKIPHPDTFIFYNYINALDFIKKSDFPVVAKLNIGASGSGVKILKERSDALKYINRIFSVGIIPGTGPKLRKGKIAARIIRKLLRPEELRERISTYKEIISDPQIGFCIFQKYVPHLFEWRVVRIGGSFYAHKKIVKDEKASGSLIKEYGDPPLSLLSFVRGITEKFGFYSQAVDLFEVGKDEYLVNEMQCIFGQSDPYQMLIGNKPGRYINLKGKWVFEEGIFNTNECYDERMEYVISILDSERCK